MTQMAVPARIERASSGLTARYPTIRRRHHWWTYPNLHRDPELARFGCYYYTIRPLVALHGIAPCPPSCKDGILLSDPRAMVGGLAAIRTRTPGTPDRCTAIDTTSPFVEWLLTVPLRVPRRVRSVSHFQTQEPNWWKRADLNHDLSRPRAWCCQVTPHLHGGVSRTRTEYHAVPSGGCRSPLTPTLQLLTDVSRWLVGVRGFGPRRSVLETDMLPSHSDPH